MSYQDDVARLYDQIVNRKPFEYDMNGDALYQQYRDQYMENGRQAMTDTTAQAAAMTGGYGNSYGATAGNQAYQQYLTQLNDLVPDLYDRAYQRYQDEGSNLYNQYSAAQSAAASEAASGSGSYTPPDDDEEEKQKEYIPVPTRSDLFNYTKSHLNGMPLTTGTSGLAKAPYNSNGTSTDKSLEKKYTTGN